MPTRTPDTDPEGPAAPEIPSFASLRDPRRRTAVDLLVPAQESPPVAAAPRPAGKPRPPGIPRPPDTDDLVRLGVHVARSVAALPVRVARWSLREPTRCLRRLLGG